MAFTVDSAKHDEMRFASRLGFERLHNDVTLTVVPIGGFAQRQRIEHAAWTFQQVLRADIAIAALLDRDYRCVEEVEELLKGVRATIPHFHILRSKEIENYLLVPDAITRTVVERLAEKQGTDAATLGCVSESITEMLEACTEAMKVSVQSQLVANRMRFLPALVKI